MVALADMEAPEMVRNAVVRLLLLEEKEEEDSSEKEGSDRM